MCWGVVGLTFIRREVTFGRVQAKEAIWNISGWTSKLFGTLKTLRSIISFIMILSNIILTSLERWTFSYIPYIPSTHSNANLSLNSLHWLDISLINLLHSAPLKFRAINNSSFYYQTTHLLIHGKSMEISSRMWFIALSLATNSNAISYEKYRSDSFFNDVVAKA